MGATLFGFILCNELRICGNAVENLFTMGARHARPFYHPDNHEFEESPQNKWLNTFKLRSLAECLQTPFGKFGYSTRQSNIPMFVQSYRYATNLQFVISVDLIHVNNEESGFS